MTFFDSYYSNTLAASGNQSFFVSDPEKTLTGRVFMRVSKGGEVPYSFLFSDTIDSTFGDGSHSRKNRTCGGWTIHSLSARVTEDCRAEEADKVPEKPVLFDGKTCKTVGAGEIFYTDPVVLSARAGQYICLTMEFSGAEIPFHPETVIPVFRKEGDGWTECVEMPLPGMTGCKRQVNRRIAFLGDSITQGCGTVNNSYTHYACGVAELLGEDNAYWDIGLGYGRADDAASRGAWLDKAKKNDIVTVCFGVNDLLQGFTAEQLKNSLSIIVHELKKAGITVILQTVPPFDYAESIRPAWNDVNRYIKNVLSLEADAVFDVVPILGERERPYMAQFGGHPNAHGHKLWAEALAPVIKTYME